LSIQNLTPMQIDFLKELSNIGGGNAATSLSQMVYRPIKMEVPRVKLLPYDKVFTEIMGEEEQVNAVSIRVLGDTPGNFLFILKDRDTMDLLKMIMGEDARKDLDEVSLSALQEICNILCSSYVNALSRLLNLSIVSSVPAYVQDMFGAILPTAYIEAGQYDDYLLVIENNFLARNNNIKAHLFFIPHPGSLHKIFSIMDI